ncbi:MAG: alpha/beta hydrolase [Proteobacteria bacterium]|nr:alpha/beta hydrolase [Pseudomonadota bacterium]
MKTMKIGPIEFNTHSWPLTPKKTTLLFIHGATLSKGFWQAQMDGLQHETNPVSIDLPGHGGSDGPGKSSIHDYAEAICDFIKMAGMNQQDVILCGMSMGGGIVLDLIIDHPHRFKAGILINTGARLKVHPMILESVKTDFTSFIRTMPTYSLSPDTAMDPFEKKIHDVASTSDKQTALMDFTACNTFDVMEKIGDITCPVLVCSAEHDLSTPPKYGFWLAQNIKQATHVHIPNAGHFSPMEKSDEINGAIKHFISKI